MARWGSAVVISVALFTVWYDPKMSPPRDSEWQLNPTDEASLIQVHVGGFLQPRRSHDVDDVLVAMREEGRLSHSLDTMAGRRGDRNYGFKGKLGRTRNMPFRFHRQVSLTSRMRRAVRNTNMTNVIVSPTTSGGETTLNFAYYTKYCALGTGFSIIFTLLLFWCFRECFPKLYEGNAKAPKSSRSALRWIGDSLKLSYAEIEYAAGFDQACLIRYTWLCMQILTVVGIPTWLISIPLSQDDLAIFDPADIATGNSTKEFVVERTYSRKTCWLYAALVFWVIGLAQVLIFHTMHEFVAHRFDYIRNHLPMQQAKAVMVSGIPTHLRSDQELKQFFEMKYPMRGGNAVKSVNFVKHSGSMRKLFYEYTRAQRKLCRAIAELQRTGVRPQRKEGCSGDQLDAITYYQTFVDDTFKAMATTRNYFIERAARDLEYPPEERVTTGDAFVQFNHLEDALLAIKNSGLPLVPAPPPHDVMFDNMLSSDSVRFRWRLLGWLLLVIAWLLFAPLVFFVAFAADFRVLEACFPSTMKQTQVLVPWFQSTWNSVGAVFVCDVVFFPLNFIFDYIFVKVCCLDSSRKIQESVQRWMYYSTLLIMVIAFIGGWCFTPIGLLLMRHETTVGDLWHHSKEVGQVFATRLEQFPDICIAFLIMQWSFIIFDLCRFTTVMKFLGLRCFLGTANAYAHADKPAYPGPAGIGARSARIVGTMAMTMMFGTLNPYAFPAGIICFIGYYLVYTYLQTYCEPEKAQSNGVFFVQKLLHTQIFLFFYVAVMAIVLFHRSATPGPGILASLAAIPLSLSLVAFHYQFDWDTIPEDMIVKDAEIPDQLFNHRSYVQPELCAPLEPKKEDAKILRSLVAANEGRIIKAHGESPSIEERREAQLGPKPPARPLRPDDYEVPCQG